MMGSLIYYGSAVLCGALSVWVVFRLVLRPLVDRIDSYLWVRAGNKIKRDALSGREQGGEGDA